MPCPPRRASKVDPIVALSVGAMRQEILRSFSPGHVSMREPIDYR